MQTRESKDNVRQVRSSKLVDNTYADGEEGNRLVDSAQGRNIDSLTTDGTLGANTGGVFTGTSVDDGIDEDLGVQHYIATGKGLQLRIHTWMGFWSVKR